ncbi:MAG: 2'-5' RNA ligase family protein [Salinigranum sp.]
MYSLNVPVPGRVERLASDLLPRLSPFERVRERHTLVAKRFEESNLDRLRERLRGPLAGQPAFEARVTGVDYFDLPARGAGPVVYLAVESPGLGALHERLVDAFGAVEGIEGPEYVPHVTLARGGSLSDAERLAGLDVERVTWTVSRLALWSAEYREAVETIALPA